MSAALMLCGSAFARQWNFTKWSASTIATLKASDTYWTNDEKGDGTTNVVPNDACVWNVNSTIATACDADSNLLAADGTIIPELEGLKWAGINVKKVAIAFDYQITTDANKWGPYNGPAYLWLNGKTTAVHFIIPKVAPGTMVKMGVETHKLPAENPEARGVDIYVGDTKLTMTPTSYPTAMAEYTWTVPEDYTDSVDLDVRPSNGCHLYYISVDEGDVVINTEDVKVAYLYDGTYNGTKDADKNPAGWLANGGLEKDGVLVGALSGFNTTTIDYSALTMTSAELNDSLLNFDVVVLSEAVSSGNTYAKGIVEIINKVPILNLKSYMYKSGVWSMGSGANPSPKATTITVSEDYLDDELFDGVDMDEGVVTLYTPEDYDAVLGNMVQGCTLNAEGAFGSDEIIATVPTGETGEESYAAIHTHGTRNKYMLIPLSSDNYNAMGGDAYLLISNAVKMLYKTKSSVQTAGTPTVTEDHGDNTTTVTLASTAVDAKIYYALGDSEFSLYSEPFVVTTDSTLVRAYAIAFGYEDSDTASVYVRVLSQASAPVIVLGEYEGYTEITL
ncbi:MAG: chitobiase/beta-hexosaminidase C-terminal domain-containing protein, partial [Bacteroidales bacterium]|nr:chitobiase/beta-hexosaminidase C-terminal domain-containing protein [Bacteroidales bacterium]